MINEKQISEMERTELRSAMAMNASTLEQREAANLVEEKIREKYRLMRLGLWAEKHGVPVMEKIRKGSGAWEEKLVIIAFADLPKT